MQPTRPPTDETDDERDEAKPCTLAPTKAKPRGWHAHRKTSPHTGRGSCTVDPIRKRKDIEAIKAALVSQPRNFALFVVGIHFGLRGSDLLSLRWDDVLTPACAILDHIEVREQKTGKQRRIAVQSNARTALALLQSRMQPDRADYVFQSRKGGRLTIQRLHQLVVEWTGDAGLRGNFGSHTLRKTMGYALRQAGVGIETVMKIYGHSSQAVTMRYLGIDQDETDEARLKLNL